VQAGITADLSAAGLDVGWSVGIGLCELSDAIRVEVGLYRDSTPGIVERVRALLTPYGDRVRLGVSPGGPIVTLSMTGMSTFPGQAAPAAVAFGR